jgi:valyl-tRNA synthetase
LENYAKSLESKLSNEQFVKNAPASLVEAEKAKIRETQDRIGRITQNLKFLEI